MDLVRSLMTTTVQTVRGNAPMAQVYGLMLDEHIRHVPVVDDDDELVGIVSHRDVAAALGQYNRDSMIAQTVVLESLEAGQVMSRGVETVEPDTPLRVAAELMLDNKYGCVPVCEGTRLVGILTEADFVRLVVDPG